MRNTELSMNFLLAFIKRKNYSFMLTRKHIVFVNTVLLLFSQLNFKISSFRIKVFTLLCFLYIYLEFRLKLKEGTITITIE